MVKDIDVNVTYNGKNHLISCQQRELPAKIAEKFGVNVNDVLLYAVVKDQRYEISLKDVKNLMKILLVPKSADQRNLRNHLESNSSLPKPFNDIVKKLTMNSTLNGIERKTLIEFIEENLSPECSKRRKINGNNKEVNFIPTKITPMVNKKVQVDTAITKESVAQTDPVNFTLDKSPDREDIYHQLKRIAHDNADTEQAMLLMEKTFNDRRKFIFIECPPVALVKERYELLFSTAEVKREIDRLNFPGKCESFLRNMEIYAPIIMKHCNQSDEVFIKTKKNMDRAQTVRQKKYAEIVGSVFALTQLLEEEFRFIRLNDHPHGSENIYPYIDASVFSLKQLFFDNILFHIYVEGIHLCDAADFPEAVLCLMAAFFIFNISYPPYNPRTLTAFEKLYLCVNDTKEMDDITEQMIKYLQLQAQGKLSKT